MGAIACELFVGAAVWVVHQGWGCWRGVQPPRAAGWCRAGVTDLWDEVLGWP